MCSAVIFIYSLLWLVGDCVASDVYICLPGNWVTATSTLIVPHSTEWRIIHSLTYTYSIGVNNHCSRNDRNDIEDKLWMIQWLWWVYPRTFQRKQLRSIYRGAWTNKSRGQLQNQATFLFYFWKFRNEIKEKRNETFLEFFQKVTLNSKNYITQFISLNIDTLQYKSRVHHNK